MGIGGLLALDLPLGESLAIGHGAYCSPKALLAVQQWQMRGVTGELEGHLLQERNSYQVRGSTTAQPIALLAVQQQWHMWGASGTRSDLTHWSGSLHFQGFY